MAISRNRALLVRIVAALLAMAGFAETASGFPSSIEHGRAPRSLPRHLHCAVLRLLRPAEAAARRLVILVARGLVVSPSPRRELRVAPVSPARKTCPARRVGFRLFDTLRRPDRLRRVKSCGVPRISVPGMTLPHPIPVRQPLTLADPIDVTPLGLRLSALAAALDDLPRHATRLARWRSRRACSNTAGRVGRLSPLRNGRPPGQPAGSRGRKRHAIHEVLADLHWFATKALEQSDTS